MKDSTAIIIGIAALWYFSKPKANVTFPGERVCMAADGNRFVWPTPNCPYADIAANGVGYTGSPGEYTPLIY